MIIEWIASRAGACAHAVPRSNKIKIEIHEFQDFARGARSRGDRPRPLQHEIAVEPGSGVRPRIEQQIDNTPMAFTA